MWLGIVSLFPEMFEAVSAYGITGRAVKNELITLDFYNPRDFATDRHRTVDDKPYGGGPGMLMKVQPTRDAIEKARSKRAAKVIYLTPQGKPLNQEILLELAAEPALILLSGRYEGIDERLISQAVDLELSIGDYVLSGGELASMVLIDGLCRLLPGALGDGESALSDSFYDGLLGYPQYTRPEILQDSHEGDSGNEKDSEETVLDKTVEKTVEQTIEKTVEDGNAVPAVLLSGDHAAIARWRKKQALGRTYERRPELLKKQRLDDEGQQLLQDYLDEKGIT